PGGSEYRLLEQVVDGPALEGDPTLERLVRAVLAPRLCERLELAVGGVAAQVSEMIADGPHFCEAQRKLPLPAQFPQLLVDEPADRDLDPTERVMLPLAETIEHQRADDRLLDGVVGQEPLDQPGEGRGRAAHVVGPDGPDVGDVESEVPEERKC